MGVLSELGSWAGLSPWFSAGTSDGVAFLQGRECDGDLVPFKLFFLYKFIYFILFIFGCVGSSLLRAGFL